VSVFHYAQTPPKLALACEHAGKLAADHGAAASRVVWFQHEPPSAEVTLVRALLSTTSTPAQSPSRSILALEDATAAVQASFPSFAEQAGDGMAYLGRCWAEDRIDTPVLVSTDQDRIVGAIGPMQAFPSPTAALQLLPQYFAVLPSYRRAGHGRALWRAAQQWGHYAGASYQMLQVAAGSPAEELYRSEGVHSLGLVCSITA
jgi:GNAT superfamily N-acetyltransferase